MKTLIKILLLFILSTNPYTSINAFKYEVTLTKAGKLSSEMKKGNAPLSIQKLKINGPINGTDLLYLKTTFSINLIELDLTNAEIVPGGKSYYETRIDSKKMKFKVTEENALEMYSLSDFSFLKVLYLPSKLSKLELAALKNCSSLEKIYFTGLFPPYNVEGIKKYSSNTSKIKNNDNVQGVTNSASETKAELESLFENFDFDDLDSSFESSSSKNNLVSLSKKTTNATPICNKIIVPEKSYDIYVNKLPSNFQNYICKDNAPTEYILDLSVIPDIKKSFAGGHEFVKKVTLIGQVKTTTLEEIKKLFNLEYLNLQKAIVGDSNIHKLLNNYSLKLVPKSSRLLDLEKKLKIAEENRTDYWVKNVNPIESRVLYLNGRIKTLHQERNSKKKELEKKQFERALISALIGISADDLKDKRNRGEVSEMEYSLNSMFLSAMDNELKKEMKGLDITNDEDFAKITEAIHKELTFYSDSLVKVNEELEKYDEPIAELKSEINPILNKWKLERTNLEKYINESSNIPTGFISKMELPNLKTIVLPDNTAVIAPNAFRGYSSDLDVIINKNNIKIADKIKGL